MQIPADPDSQLCRYLFVLICREGLSALHLACAQDSVDGRCVEYLLGHKVGLPCLDTEEFSVVLKKRWLKSKRPWSWSKFTLNIFNKITIITHFLAFCFAVILSSLIQIHANPDPQPCP